MPRWSASGGDRPLWLEAPRRNPEIDVLAEMIRTRQTKTLAAGIDQIMADLKDLVSARRARSGIMGPSSCSWEYRRDPRPDEPGAAWIQNAQAHRGLSAVIRGGDCHCQLHASSGL